MKQTVQSGDWDKFWKEKGISMEWTPKDILVEKSLIEKAQKIKQFFPEKNLKDIELLELGAGMGITSLCFASLGMKVVLLDKSEESVSKARQYWGNVATHTYIIEDLFKFETSQRFDVVTSYGLCEHFKEEERIAVLQKHYDLLKEKGMIIISTPHRYGIFYRMSIPLQKLVGRWDFGYELGFTKKEFIDFAKKNNLKYEIEIAGFYSSAHELFIRKPLKLFKINVKKRFVYTKSRLFDRWGAGIVVVYEKTLRNIKNDT